MPSATPSRITGNAQITSSERADHRVDPAAGSSRPGARARSTASAVISAARIPMISELRAAVEQPHHDVAAVAVGAQEVLASATSARSARRRARPRRSSCRRPSICARQVVRRAVRGPRCPPRPAPRAQAARAPGTGRRSRAPPCCGAGAAAPAATARRRRCARARPPPRRRRALEREARRSPVAGHAHHLAHGEGARAPAVRACRLLQAEAGVSRSGTAGGTARSSRSPSARRRTWRPSRSPYGAT